MDWLAVRAWIGSGLALGLADIVPPGLGVAVASGDPEGSVRRELPSVRPAGPLDPAAAGQPP